MNADAQNILSALRVRTSFACLLPALICALVVCTVAPLKADTITLNSGEVLQGRILSETDTQVEVEVSLYHGSIITERQVLKTDIQSIVRENLEQMQEKAAYEALSKYTLNPNHELTHNQYAAGIAAFQKFQATYTNSNLAKEINKRIADWRTESSNVESGKVKFANKWMTPEEKRTQTEASQKPPRAEKRTQTEASQKLPREARRAQTETSQKPSREARRAQTEASQKPPQVEAPRETLQTLTNRLASLQVEQKQAAKDLKVAEGQLTAAETQLESLKDTTEPRYDPATKTQMKDDRGNPVFQVIPNPERPNAEGRVESAQQQVNRERGTLGSLDRKIADVRSKIQELEQEQQTALIKSNEPPKQSVAKVQPSRPPPPPPPPPEPKPEPTPPWYIRVWKWVHG
jgi:hypothetical protein